jgi:hypothetical protein
MSKPKPPKKPDDAEASSLPPNIRTCTFWGVGVIEGMSVGDGVNVFVGVEKNGVSDGVQVGVSVGRDVADGDGDRVADRNDVAEAVGD